MGSGVPIEHNWTRPFLDDGVSVAERHATGSVVINGRTVRPNGGQRRILGVGNLRLRCLANRLGNWWHK